jgi:DNA-3-methyladenine glycosylase
MTARFLLFDADPVMTARRLLGQRLVHVVDGERLAGEIVEVEAYLGPIDRAAHTYGGRRSIRNESMWRGGGTAYVYFTYGMHFCMNVVCGPVASGTAVLLRALEPTEGLDAMRARRPAARSATELCSGPAKLTQALGIDRACDGRDLRDDARLFVERIRARPLPDAAIGATPRIGVDYAGAWTRRRLRFFVRGNPNVSGARVTRPASARSPRCTSAAPPKRPREGDRSVGPSRAGGCAASRCPARWS